MLKAKLVMVGIRFLFSVLPALFAVFLLYGIRGEHEQVLLFMKADLSIPLEVEIAENRSEMELLHIYVFTVAEEGGESLRVLAPSRDWRALFGTKAVMYKTTDTYVPYVLASMADEYSAPYELFGVYFTLRSFLLFAWGFFLLLYVLAFELNVREEDEAPILHWSENPKMQKLAKRLEKSSKKNLFLYTLKVKLLGLFGISIIPLSLLFLGGFGITALVVSFMVGKYGLAFGKVIVLPLGYFLYGVVKALKPPQQTDMGFEIQRDESPELWQTVERVRKAVGAPKIHTLMIDDQFNASIHQKSASRFLWLPRTTLTVGLPLLETLSEDEVEAVIAHEMGHLAGGHGASGAWIYYLRNSWDTLRATALREEKLSWIFVKLFLRKFVPYFQAYSYELSRRNEYAADRAMVAAFGQETAARALSRIFISGQVFNQHFWPDVFLTARDLAEPDLSPFRDIAAYMRDVPEGLTAYIMEDALSWETSLVDTHPSVYDRLEAIGSVLKAYPAPDKTAAATLLGGAHTPVMEAITKTWWDEAQNEWLQIHSEWNSNLKRHKAIKKAIAKGRADEDTLTEHVWLSAELEDRAALKAAYELLYTHFPKNARANLYLGALKLEADDETGLDMVKYASAADESYMAEATQVAVEYLERTGQEEEAEAFRERFAEYSRIEKEAYEEREFFTLDEDILLPHGLSDKALQPILRALKKVPQIKEAHLFRKALKHKAEEDAVFICAVKGISIMHMTEDPTPMDMLAEHWPHGTYNGFLISVETQMPKLKKHLPKDGSALIYKRG
ncbi:M48 family metallopeptidase [Kordiimonas laminariae]|uniref:M48 family metallopeptidase n=1 Tax=Kordiimonas laminariae TaxID=2917717 RepID=UPI001FF5D0B4|nr:M48 family metallopeptidase [Kordiimonas laminariae]MCK0070740.1 M48 family metalloprotease [Kordiimonas laminariae]